MGEDKYSALWVSHTSLQDFLTCPRAYYLKNVYKNPRTNRKIKIMTPPLALGQAVHEVLESLSVLPSDERFNVSLLEKFETVWKKVAGKRGGFLSSETESQYKKRGEEMMLRVMKNPGPLKNLAVKIRSDSDMPYYWLSKEDNIILCGKIDWLEYLPATDSVHIIDFKTSKNDEEGGSMQLPIYCLLTSRCQSKPVEKISYWYLGRNDDLTPEPLPDLGREEKRILEIAKKIKIARQLNVFKCPHKTGCHACRPFERILKGEAEQVGIGSYREEIYILDQTAGNNEGKSIIL